MFATSRPTLGPNPAVNLCIGLVKSALSRKTKVPPVSYPIHLDLHFPKTPRLSSLLASKPLWTPTVPCTNAKFHLWLSASRNFAFSALGGGEHRRSPDL